MDLAHQEAIQRDVYDWHVKFDRRRNFDFWVVEPPAFTDLVNDMASAENNAAFSDIDWPCKYLRVVRRDESSVVVLRCRIAAETREIKRQLERT